MGEPRRPALRLAHPVAGRLRRVQPRAARLAGRRDRGHAPLHHAPQAAAPQHDAGPAPGRSAGHRPPARPVQRAAAAPRPPPLPLRVPAGPPRLLAHLLGRGLRARRRGPARRPARAHGLLRLQPRHHQRGLLHVQQGRAPARHEPRRPLRPPLPRGHRRRAQVHHRHRRAHLLLVGPHRHRPRAAPGHQPVQQPARLHEVPHGGQAPRHPRRRGQHHAREGPGALLGPLGPALRPVRHAPPGRLHPHQRRRRHRLPARRVQGRPRPRRGGPRLHRRPHHRLRRLRAQRGRRGLAGPRGRVRRAPPRHGVGGRAARAGPQRRHGLLDGPDAASLLACTTSRPS